MLDTCCQELRGVYIRGYEKDTNKPATYEHNAWVAMHGRIAFSLKLMHGKNTSYAIECYASKMEMQLVTAFQSRELERASNA